MLKRLTLILFLTTLIFSVECYAQQTSNDFHKIATIQLQDYQQQKQVTINVTAKPLTVLVFLSPECPLCKNYTKTLNELNATFAKHVQVIGIIPGSTYTSADINTFIAKYRVDFPILLDTSKALANYVQASVTPQAVLLDDKTYLLYTGAIDDWAQSLGKQRLQVSQHYLHDAIQQSLQAVPVKIAKTTPVGCKINDY